MTGSDVWRGRTCKERRLKETGFSPPDALNMLFPTFLGCDAAPQFPRSSGRGASNKMGPLGFWLQINQGHRGQLGVAGDKQKELG